MIWATQVLASLAPKGIPSRSEITDVAMGERAECVKLNKGPYAVTTVQAHQEKKLHASPAASRRLVCQRRLSFATLLPVSLLLALFFFAFPSSIGARYIVPVCRRPRHVCPFSQSQQSWTRD
jgi:hypothetical protein